MLRPEVRSALLRGSPTSLFNSYGTHLITGYQEGAYADGFVDILKHESSNQATIQEMLNEQLGGGLNFEIGVIHPTLLT